MKKEFFINNRKKYLEKVENNSLSLFFSGKEFQKSADHDFPFEVDKNFYYLTGINQANVILAIVKKNNVVNEVLFIDKNDPVLIKWVGKKLEIKEAKEISGIESVAYMDTFKTFVFSSFNNSRISTSLTNLYLNIERKNEKGYTNQALEFVKEFKENYPEVNVFNSYNLVINLRMFKTEEEVQLIKESIKTTGEGLNKLMENCRPGLYEYQIETYFDQYIKFNGKKDYAFETIAATGKNATILHYVANNSILEDNNLILFDLGARTEFYVSDISRTYPVNGKFTNRQKDIYQEVLEVNKKCIEYLKPNVTWPEFNKYARELLADACRRLGLIKEDSELINYYYHSIGHFMGLDAHDPGLYDQPLQEGMVVTVEPGLYIAEEGIGVRIEDDILITKDGHENLSKDIIKEVVDIENFFKSRK